MKNKIIEILASAVEDAFIDIPGDRLSPKTVTKLTDLADEFANEIQLILMCEND